MTKIASLERIIAASKTRKERNIKKLNFGNILFIEYFCQNLNNQQIHASISKGLDLFSIVSMDYYKRFGGKVAFIDNFLKVDNNKLMDKFYELLSKKDPNHYKKNRDNSVGLADVESEIVASIYMDQIRNKSLKDLIKNSTTINDLKAIMVSEIIIPGLKYNKVEKILKSELSPEQIFIKLSTIKYLEKNIENLDETLQEIENISNHSEQLMKSNLTKKNARNLIKYMDKIKTIDKNFEYFKDNENYQKAIGNFFKRIYQITNSIEHYIKSNTSNMLNSIDQDIENSNILIQDFECAKKQFDTYKEIKIYHEWFKVHSKKLIKIGERIQNKYQYLSSVIETNTELDKMFSLVHKYFKVMGDLNMDKTTARKILDIKKEVAQDSDKYEIWKDDHYLSEKVAKFYKLTEMCSQTIEECIKSNTEDILSTIDAKFQLSDNPHADLDRNNVNLQLYQDIKNNYEWLEVDSSPLSPIDEKLKQRCQYLEGVIETKEKLEQRITQMNEYITRLGQIKDE
jgi:hypothetical protein